MSKKDECIDRFIEDLFVPYIVYLKMTLSEDEIYKKLKKNKTIESEKINLYFLMEIIKKKIELLDK